MSNSTLSSGNITVQGWTDSDDTRGTWQLISECAATFILCSWSCVCCNIPAPTDTFTRHVLRKCWLTFISLLGPEYLLLIALGQYISAKRSVVEFKKLGYDGWTMKHAFYTDMGGFRLQTTDEDAFPVGTKSLLWLIQEGFISSKQVEEEILIDPNVIEDRNKTDFFVRLIALGQTCWFTANVIARFALRYSVSTLELTLLGYLVPVAVTHWLWWHKPRDVFTANQVKVNVSIKEVQERIPPEDRCWYVNPLDSIERAEFHGSILYRYWFNSVTCILQSLRAPFMKQKRQDTVNHKPRQYRSDNDLLDMAEPFKYGWVEVLPTMWYLGTIFIAWNWHFPTPIERWMWRSACIGMSIPYILGAWWESFLIYRYSVDVEKEKLARYRSRASDSRKTLDAKHSKQETSLFQRFKLRLQLTCQNLRQNPAVDDPTLDVSLRLLIPATLGLVIYVGCRLYIIVEDFAGLREMPSDVYKSAPWTQVIPHIG